MNEIIEVDVPVTTLVKKKFKKVSSKIKYCNGCYFWNASPTVKCPVCVEKNLEDDTKSKDYIYVEVK